MINLTSALNYIDPASLNYEEWLEIGMALKVAAESGDPVSWKDWETWSSQDPDRYKPGECQRKWNTFNSKGITKGTLIKKAMDNGYSPLSTEVLSWDDEIQYDGEEPANRDFLLYIKALFNPNDKVNYVLDTFEDDGKYKPASSGVLGIKASTLISNFERYQGDMPKTVGDYNKEAGGWIRFNPVDGKGVANKNITDYRYVLVESDEISPDEQLKMIYNLKLPCAAIVTSGAKSIHAIVHIDAKTQDEYKKRVQWLFTQLSDLGFPVDQANKNPARLSRMPGLKRGEEYQRLIDTNTGYANFSEWKEYCENGLEDLNLPQIDKLSEVWDNMPELAPELIEGVLRQGHKMLLAASSKAGKSFALIELAIAIAEGGEWFGFKCRKGKVLYINLEIDEASFFHRVKDVYEAKGIIPQGLENLDIWNLRGRAMAMSKLTPKLISRVRDEGYDAIILDPVYKVQSGDENAAGDIAKFTNEFDRITAELGCSMIYCHHHSKGFQGGKRSIDRASGSGVFSRDPDSILDMIELDDEHFKNLEQYQGMSGWRLEGTLREFAPFTPRNIFFNYPIHEIDKTGILENAKLLGDTMMNERQDATDWADQFDVAFDVLSPNGQWVNEEDIANYFGIKVNTLRRKYKEYRECSCYNLERKNGKVIRVLKD